MLIIFLEFIKELYFIKILNKKFRYLQYLNKKDVLKEMISLLKPIFHIESF